MESPLKVSVIVLTAFVTVGVGFAGVKLYSGLGQTDVLEADPVAQTDTSSLSVETRLAKGDQFMTADNPTDAAEQYRYATQLDAQNADAFLKLGGAELALHQNDAALTDFKTAYTLTPNFDSAAAYAHGLMIQGNWDDAQNILSSIAEANQNLLYQKALFNVMQNHSDQAKTEFSAALQNSGTLPPATLQNFLTAYSTFDSAQGAEPTYLQALLCKALVDAQEFDLAATLSQTVLNQKNDYRDVWMLLGYSKTQLGEYSDAEAAFRQAKKIDSLKPEVHYFLGDTLLQEKKYGDAIGELELSLLYGFNPAEEAYKKIADAHEAQQQWSDAVAAYEALLNLSPDSADLFQKPIELCLSQLHDTDRALTLAQKATGLFPGAALSHTLLAEVYLAQGKIDSANTEINTAFQIDANFVPAHYTAGLVREAQNNTQGAEWEFKKAFDLSDDSDPLRGEAATEYNKLLTQPTP